MPAHTQKIRLALLAQIVPLQPDCTLVPSADDSLVITRYKCMLAGGAPSTEQAVDSPHALVAEADLPNVQAARSFTLAADGVMGMATNGIAFRLILA